MMKDGIYYGMVDDIYHNLPRVSKSYLWKMNTVPAAAKVPFPESAEMAIGSATHAYILEGADEFLRRFAVAPKCDKRTKEGKALWESFCAAEDGKQIISQDDFTMILGMSNAVHAHPMASKILSSGGIPEVSALWTDNETGLSCKSRADLVTPQQVIVDLKTCRSASSYGFNRAVQDYGYHVQAAFYLEAFRELADCFTFIAVEKTAPFRVEVYDLDESYLLKGREKYRELLDLEMECRTTGYPHYTDAGIQTLYAPAYL